MKDTSIIKLIAPDAWASYLINGDASSLEADDIAQADAWIDREGLGLPLSCEDAGFHWHHDAQQECPLGCSCQEYAFRAY